MPASLDNGTRLPGRRARSLIDKLWPIKRRTGATAMEYCVIASLISVAIIGGAQMVGLTASTSLEKSKTEIEEAVEAANDN